MKRQIPQKPNAGLTLIELLVVIAIIGLLVAIISPIVQKSRRSADRVTAMNNMRQIGLAIQLYTNDHYGRLPTSYILQRARMRNFPGQLSSYTADYLGITHVQDAINPFFADNYWIRSLGTSHNNLPNFLINVEPQAHRFILNRWNEENREHFPWGSPEGGPQGYRFSFIRSPSATWAMQDIDSGIRSQHPLTTPLWGNQRMALYFDWHVGFIPSDEFRQGPAL